MNIIDHRILIPAPQDKVWQHISDVTRNPDWQTDCQSVSILTTMKIGPGLRWRSTSKSGREYVIEISAWYDRLGYEYRIVDGTPYQSNKGLLRLQELPEGTVVQWTFSYEPKGMLGGLQNAISTKRRVENEIISSLKMLYRYMGKSASNEVVQAKSLMREAPDVEARAHYKPRHPLAEEKLYAPLTQPVIMEDDTRPNPVVAEVREPDFLTALPITDTKVTSVTVADTEERFKPPATQPHRVDEVPLAVEPSPTAETERPFELPRIKETSEIDTSKISVFEIFGLPKPSETQEMKAVTALPDRETLITPQVIQPPTSTQSTTVVQIVSSEKRVGLRRVLRRNVVHLRRPS
jgi:uncharacterized membrane protein